MPWIPLEKYKKAVPMHADVIFELLKSSQLKDNTAAQTIRNLKVGNQDITSEALLRIGTLRCGPCVHGNTWHVTVESIANLYSRAPEARCRTAQGGAQRNPG